MLRRAWLATIAVWENSPPPFHVSMRATQPDRLKECHGRANFHATTDATNSANRGR